MESIESKLEEVFHALELRLRQLFHPTTHGDIATSVAAAQAEAQATVAAHYGSPGDPPTSQPTSEIPDGYVAQVEAANVDGVATGADDKAGAAGAENVVNVKSTLEQK